MYWNTQITRMAFSLVHEEDYCKKQKSIHSQVLGWTRNTGHGYITLEVWGPILFCGCGFPAIQPAQT